VSAQARPAVTGLDHLLLQTTDLSAAERFYIEFLGFTVRKRDATRDGRRLTVTHQGLGLTDGGPRAGGPVEHIAFEARGIFDFETRARAAGVTIELGPVWGAYGWSLYLLDPDGNKIELFGDEDLGPGEPSRS
jgi:catechol 2,3-dioxygenase-like lactoylglutathione lyase family enzyme